MAEDVFGTIFEMVSYVGWTCEILSHRHFACLSSPLYSFFLHSNESLMAMIMMILGTKERKKCIRCIYCILKTKKKTTMTTSTFSQESRFSTKWENRHVFETFFWIFVWKKRNKPKFMFNIEFMNFIFDDRFGAELTLCREWRCAKIVSLYLYSEAERSKVAVAVGRSMNVSVHVNCCVPHMNGFKDKKQLLSFRSWRFLLL